MPNAMVGRDRPAMFKALGERPVPAVISVEGQAATLSELYKHDSWAATARYLRADGESIICKFNRIESIFGVKLDWLGRTLARRERNALAALAGVPGIPEVYSSVYVDGRHWPNAIARRFVAGHPLGHRERISNRFLMELRVLLHELHRRGIAFVDLHKRENILVGNDGRPYLVDFQIHFDRADRRLAWLLWKDHIFDILAESDRYHLSKHEVRHGNASTIHLPVWIRMHRLIAVPFRELRRKLLVAIGVRTGKGRVESESFIEDGLRSAA
jgi:hypothetical protein